MDNAAKDGAALHLMGLLSDGGVHSHNTHLYGLLEMAKKRGVRDVFVHCLMDGRDVPPTSGVNFLAELQEKMKEIGVGRIARHRPVLRHGSRQPLGAGGKSVRRHGVPRGRSGRRSRGGGEGLV